MSKVFPSAHPLVHHHLAALRDTSTHSAEFRRLVRTLASLITIEATADLMLQAREVTTPLGPAKAQVVSGRIGIVPILRAGLGMADGVLDLIPDAEVWHIGLYRDEKTLRPMEYYNKLSMARPVSLALVVDPMLATGGSALRACELLKSWGVPSMKLISLIAAPEGISHLATSMPDVHIHVGVVDERLNEKGFIYPGLGDAGDRQFNTIASLSE